MTKGDLQHAREWYGAGFTNAMKTPDDTLVFVTPEEEKIIRERPGRLHGLPVAMRLLVLGGQ